MANCSGLVYDRTGYGNSSPLCRTRTIHYLHDYALKELPEILERTIPGKPFILIDHSDGGNISLIFGAEKPALLKAIITEVAHVFVEPETLKGILAAVGAYEKGHFRGLKIIPDEIANNGAYWILDCSCCQHPFLFGI